MYKLTVVRKSGIVKVYAGDDLLKLIDISRFWLFKGMWVSAVISK